MAAGDKITGPGQMELRETLMGVGTIYGFDRGGGGVTGLFSDVAKYAESEWAHADGSFIPEVFKAAKTVTAALKIQATTEAGAWAGLDVMQATWEPGGDEEPLHFRFGNLGKRYLVGRPLGLFEDIAMAAFGQIHALATFRVTDPTIHS